MLNRNFRNHIRSHSLLVQLLQALSHHSGIRVSAELFSYWLVFIRSYNLYILPRNHLVRVKLRYFR